MYSINKTFKIRILHGSERAKYEQPPVQLGVEIHTRVFSSNGAEYNYGKNLSSGVIPASERICRYSSSKVIVLWCSFWFLIYSIRIFTSLQELVNDPYPSSYPMNEGKSLVFFIQKEDEALISLTKSAVAIEGCISERICK